MQFDWVISFPALIAIGTVLAGGIATTAVLIFRLTRLEKDFAEHETILSNYRAEGAVNSSAVLAQIKMNHDIVMNALSQQRDALKDFQVYVAQNYAGNTALEKMEERLTAEVRILRGGSAKV